MRDRVGIFPDVRWVFLAIPVSLGLFLVWGGIVGAMNARALQSRGVRTTGTVVDAARTVSRRATTYNPVVEFTGADGRKHRFETSVGAKRSADEVERGKSFDVVYVVDDPALAVIAGYEGSIPSSITMALFGLVILSGIWALTRSGESGFAIAGSLRWVAVGIVAAAGVALLLSGLTWSARRYLLLQGGARAEGTVLSHLPAARGSGFMAVFAFKSADGQQHQLAASELTPYKEGTRVQVVYRPDDPSKAVVHDFQQFWLGPLAVTLMGVFFVGLAALARVFVRDAG